MTEVLWPLGVIGAGLLVSLSGGALFARVRSRGGELDVANLTSGQKLSARLMLGGSLVAALGALWLLVLGIARFTA